MLMEIIFLKNKYTEIAISYFMEMNTIFKALNQQFKSVCASKYGISKM